MVLNPIAVLILHPDSTVITHEDGSRHAPRRVAAKELHRRTPSHLDYPVYEAHIGDTTAEIPVDDVREIIRFGPTE